MKELTSYITERGAAPIKTSGATFKHTVKYSNEDWEKWMKMWKKNDFGKDIFIGNYENSKDDILIYKVNNKDKTMDHIGTYFKKQQTLHCDDINLFGNEK